MEMNPGWLLVLLIAGVAVYFAMQAGVARRRATSEDKVLKGYFLLGLSGLMAKIVQADGVVTEDETEMSSRIFKRMDITDAERAMCIGNFVTARRDGLTARDHTKRFMAYANSEASKFLLNLLWKLSMADGKLDGTEDKLMTEISRYLGLDVAFYEDLKSGKRFCVDKEELRLAGVPPSLLSLA